MLSGRLPPPSIDAPVSILEDDQRWLLVQRILVSRQFSKAPLLSRFLTHICEETLRGRQHEISEHQIGIQVFDRPKDYRTVEDNIVRNYARQLRKRLAEYFETDGHEENLRIEIPLGGYIPVFTALPSRPFPVESVRVTTSEPRSASRSNQPPYSHESIPIPISDDSAVRPDKRRLPLRIALFFAYSVVLVAASVFVSRWISASNRPAGPASALWNVLFHSQMDTFIVPADCGFNILQDLSHKQLTLAGYLKGDYLNLPLSGMDAHSQTDLRTQEFTSFVDLQVVTSLARLPQVNPERLYLRFPRDVRLEDMKSGNVVVIGSDSSNPWAELAQKNLNFRIQYDSEIQAAWITNAHPKTGEQDRYLSHWNEPAHSTYAVIAFEPNVAGSGHILLIEGLDVAGTQAAAEALFHGNALQPILRAAKNGPNLRPFEVLLQSTSIASNAAGTQVVAYRIE